MELPTTFKAAIADRYEIESLLSESAMAGVFLANDLRHRRRVSIKILRPDATVGLSDVRFVREIKFLAHLTHPNILPLYDSGHAKSYLYYVTPYVPGETLRARMTREGRLTVRDAVRITCQVASALDYAHRHAVIHRDIKPENILLSDAHVMLMDFGIARAIGMAAGEQLTAPLSVGPGTPAYMSPEQFMPGQELDGRSDIYSLATVMYEMLTGELPYSAANAQAVIMRKLGTEATRLRTVRSDVPEPIDRAVARALSPTPTARFGSATEFASALESAITPAFVPVMEQDAAGKTARLGGFSRLHVAAMLVGVIALVALIIRFVPAH